MAYEQGGYGGGGGGGGYGHGGGGGWDGGGGGGGSGPPRHKQFADRTVFIGNISWESTEDQLRAHCSAAGRVTHIRLVTDPQTGKAKGYAFCEFIDGPTAANAVRHLNGADFNGRPLRVDFSDPAHRSTLPPGARSGGGGAAGHSAPAMGMQPAYQAGGGAAGQSGEELRRIFANTSAAAAPAAPATLPQPADIAPVSYESTIGSQAPAVAPAAQPYGTDTILKLVQSLTKAQLLEILSEMKKFSVANPEGARQLLNDSPQVAQTMLQILILFGMVRPADVAAIQTNQRPVAQGAPTLMAQQQPVAQPQPQMQMQQPPIPAAAPAPYPVQPMMYPPPAMAPSYPAPTPVFAPPPPVPAPAAAAPPTFTEQDTLMLREIMKLGPEQIAQLPQDVQDKIRLLQQQMQM